MFFFFFIKYVFTCRSAAYGLSSNCTESKQCQEMNADSTCNTVSKKSECQQGFIQHFNSCIPGMLKYRMNTNLAKTLNQHDKRVV